MFRAVSVSARALCHPFRKAHEHTFSTYHTMLRCAALRQIAFWANLQQSAPRCCVSQLESCTASESLGSSSMSCNSTHEAALTCAGGTHRSLFTVAGVSAPTPSPRTDASTILHGVPYSELGSLTSRSSWSLFPQQQQRCVGSISATLGTAAVPKKSKTDISHYVSVILLKDISGLGKRGDVKTANPGWVRLKLFPAGSVVYATVDNVEKFSQMSAEPTKEDSEADREKRLCKLLTSLTTAHLNFSRRNGWKTSEPERMLEPITAKQIQATTQLQLGIALDPSHLLMDAPITGFGTYKIPLNLRTKEGVQAELTVNVRAVRRTRSGKMFG